MTAPESINHQIGGINNQITDEFGSRNDLTVTGGGRGWTARTSFNDDGFVEAKGTSKLGAAEALYEAIKAADRAQDYSNIIVRTGEALDLTDEDMSEAEFEQCVAECVTSVRNYCDCKCQGRNHGAATGATGAILIGEKPCACGCGQTTQRRFVAGHDAKYHARVALIEFGLAEGILPEGITPATDPAKVKDADLEPVRKAKAANLRKAARERRAAKRAGAKVAEAALEAKVHEVAKTITAPRKSRRVRPTSQTPKRGFKVTGDGPAAVMDLLAKSAEHDDDLPF
jgi:hypothetical protein